MPPSLLVRSRTFLALLVAVGLTPAASAAWRYDDVDRIVAIGDVHGAYRSMVRTLEAAGIVDDALAWQGGRANLVVTGDLLDRGADSRQAMDLLMRLETEAPEVGGRVHVLLGNHEVMNLVGDLRYVAAAEYAAFADEETPEERERWYAAAVRRDPALSREAFDEAAPPGFFAHRRAFAPDGRYGRWLLEKPVVIVIGKTAFAHGGLSPVVTERGLNGVNREMRGQVVEYVRDLATVTGAGYLLPTDGFYQHAGILGATPPDETQSPEVREALQSVIRLNAADIHDQDSPLWYRGNVACSPLLEKSRLDAALRELDAGRVVIGHTPTPGREVLERLEGRVYEIDTGMLADYYGGSGHALVIEGDRMTVIGESGEASAPVRHPRRVDSPSEDAPEAEMAALLSSGEILSTTEQGGRTVVTVAHGDGQVNAVFVPNPRTRGVLPELAAYRLDRLLDLGMVPVTVRREVDGRHGVLQYLPPSAIDERQRSARGDGGSAWCPLPLQWQAMYGFDALIYNPERVAERIHYTQPDWQLVLSGHDDAFDPRDERPAYLRNTEISPGGAWLAALTSIDNDVLKAELGDVLDKRRLLALYQRRDQLLREARTK